MTSDSPTLQQMIAEAPFQLDAQKIRSSAWIMQNSEAIGNIDVMKAVAFLVAQCYGAANAAGWHTDLATGQRKVHNHGERMMLCISEISEGMEGFRKSKPGMPVMDDKLPGREMLEVELADCLIRVFDYCGYLGINMERCLLAVRAEYLSEHETLQIDVENVPERLVQICSMLTGAYDCGQGISSLLEDDSRFKEAIGRSLAIAVHMIIDLARFKGYDMGAAMSEKMEFNAVRPDHKIEARKAEGGKSF